MITVRFRSLSGSDSALVFSFLTIAARLEDSHEPIQKALVDPYLASYWEGWGRAGDLGVVALRESDGLPISCAWVRRFSPEDAQHACVDDRTPELAFGTIAGERGKGVGSETLRRLIDACRPVAAGISLSVRAESPAVRLYERLGFETIAELSNRVGTRSLKMLLRFPGGA